MKKANNTFKGLCRSPEEIVKTGGGDITVKETAKILNISKSRVIKLITSKTIEARPIVTAKKSGKPFKSIWLVSGDSVKKYIENKGTDIVDGTEFGDKLINLFKKISCQEDIKAAQKLLKQRKLELKIQE